MKKSKCCNAKVEIKFYERYVFCIPFGYVGASCSKCHKSTKIEGKAGQKGEIT